MTTKPATSSKPLVAKTGIRTHFGRDADLKTTVKLRVIGRQQQLIRLDFENTPKSEVLATQTATFTRLLAEHDAILFSDYGKGGLAHVSDMIARPVRPSKPILIDPKGSDYSRYQQALPSSPPTAPNCSKSSAPGPVKTICTPKPMPAQATAIGCRAADPQRRRHDPV